MSKLFLHPQSKQDQYRTHVPSPEHSGAPSFKNFAGLAVIIEF